MNIIVVTLVCLFSLTYFNSVTFAGVPSNQLSACAPSVRQAHRKQQAESQSARLDTQKKINPRTVEDIREEWFNDPTTLKMPGKDGDRPHESALYARLNVAKNIPEEWRALSHAALSEIRSRHEGKLPPWSKMSEKERSAAIFFLTERGLLDPRIESLELPTSEKKAVAEWIATKKALIIVERFREWFNDSTTLKMPKQRSDRVGENGLYRRLRVAKTDPVEWSALSQALLTEIRSRHAGELPSRSKLSEKEKDAIAYFFGEKEQLDSRIETLKLSIDEKNTVVEWITGKPSVGRH